MAVAKRHEHKKRNRISKTLAAQEQAIRANTIKTKIDKNQVKSKCRLYGKKDGSVTHIVCECPMLAKREYKRRHN